MKPSKHLLITLVASIVVLAQPARAQLGLIETYELALTGDPALREAEANYLATAEAKPQARASLLPTLGLGASLSSQFSENPNPPLDFQTGLPSVIIASTEVELDSENVGLNLEQTIFNWGRYVSLRQADKTVIRAETDYAAAQQDLMIRVATNYFNVLAAEDTLASMIAARESIARQLEQAQQRFEVGLIAITDVQESQAGYDRAVADQIAAERVLATSHEFLREIIGEYVTNLEGPTDNLPLLDPAPADPEQWVAMALEQNLALVSTRINRDIADDQISIERSIRMPTLSLTAGVSDRTSDQLQTNNLFTGNTLTIPSATTQSEGYNWQLNFRMPLYTGGVNRSRIQQSVYRHRAAIEATERVARQTERQARDAYLGVTSEISRVRALRQAVESARTALRATEAGFEVGTRTPVDVLAFQNSLRSAETTYSRSRYDYILNILRLKQAAGSLALVDMQEIDGWLE